MKFLGVALLMVILVNPSHGGIKDITKYALSKLAALLSDASEIVCTAAELSHISTYPSIHQMQFRLLTACNSQSVPLPRAHELIKSKYFDPNKKVVILVPGWLYSTGIYDIETPFRKAYNCRGDVNFIIFDVPSLNSLLYFAITNDIKLIGGFLAQGLEQLAKVVPVENIHLIGFSLGAHIAGAAGEKFFENTKRKIPRITGLDPAKPCFTAGRSSLNSDRATFVDVIHSSPGAFGLSHSIGHADFYPNGLDTLQTDTLSHIISHLRGYEYYVESVYPGNERNFAATHCRVREDLEAEKCAGHKATMGFAAEHTSRGDYFLPTNSEPPYGNNAKYSGSHLTKNCGECMWGKR